MPEKDLINKLEPSTILFPSMVKCDDENCSKRGKYTFCYLGKEFDKCRFYKIK